MEFRVTVVVCPGRNTVRPVAKVVGFLAMMLRLPGGPKKNAQLAEWGVSATPSDADAATEDSTVTHPCRRT